MVKTGLLHSYRPCNLNIDTCENYGTNICLKFSPQHNYYTDGSFQPKEEIKPGLWKQEKTSYGIYSRFKASLIKRKTP